jgi:uncharacterized protein YkwD
MEKFSKTTALQREALSAHNKFRARHHAPNLVWDEALATYAERYANKCRFQHSSSPYGENLAAGYPSITASINKWYSEQTNYSYNRPRFSMNTGHFTQVIWKASTKLGCGYVACNGKNGTPGKYLVCEYSPPGNVTNRGFFEANVLPDLS